MSSSFIVTGIAGGSGRATIEGRDCRDGNGLGVAAGYGFKRHWSISGDARSRRLGANDNHAVLLVTGGYLVY